MPSAVIDLEEDDQRDRRKRAAEDDRRVPLDALDKSAGWRREAPARARVAPITPPPRLRRVATRPDEHDSPSTIAATRHRQERLEAVAVARPRAHPQHYRQQPERREARAARWRAERRGARGSAATRSAQRERRAQARAMNDRSSSRRADRSDDQREERRRHHERADPARDRAEAQRDGDVRRSSSCLRVRDLRAGAPGTRGDPAKPMTAHEPSVSSRSQQHRSAGPRLRRVASSPDEQAARGRASPRPPRRAPSAGRHRRVAVPPGERASEQREERRDVRHLERVPARRPDDDARA